MSNESKGEGGAVLVERRGHVLVVTINRPEVRNAVNLGVHMGVGEALEQAQADPDIRCVILTGAGDRAFCAGADLVAVARGEAVMPTGQRHAAWGFAGLVSHPISKPVIAAVNGFALAGGCEIVLACDLVVASDTARFGLLEVKHGLLAGAGGIFRLVRQVPEKIALELILTGEPIEAARAAALGLVNHVVPPDLLMARAFELAEKIAVNAPLAVQASKRVALGMDVDRIAAEEDHWARTRREMDRLRETEDWKEGPRAFAEKRAPVWKGR